MIPQPATAGLRHHVQPDGGVILSIVAEDGRRLSVSVTDSQAKAADWSILADLDPEEADASGVSDAVVLAACRQPPLTPNTAKLLLALEAGHATARALSEASGIGIGFVAARMIDLKAKGFAVRTDAGQGRGIKAKYAITADGRRALAHIREIASS